MDALYPHDEDAAFDPSGDRDDAHLTPDILQTRHETAIMVHDMHLQTGRSALIVSEVHMSEASFTSVT